MSRVLVSLICRTGAVLTPAPRPRPDTAQTRPPASVGSWSRPAARTPLMRAAVRERWPQAESDLAADFSARWLG